MFVLEFSHVDSTRTLHMNELDVRPHVLVQQRKLHGKQDEDEGADEDTEEKCTICLSILEEGEDVRCVDPLTSGPMFEALVPQSCSLSRCLYFFKSHMHSNEQRPPEAPWEPLFAEKSNLSFCMFFFFLN